MATKYNNSWYSRGLPSWFGNSSIPAVGGVVSRLYGTSIEPTYNSVDTVNNPSYSQQAAKDAFYSGLAKYGTALGVGTGLGAGVLGIAAPGSFSIGNAMKLGIGMTDPIGSISGIMGNTMAAAAGIKNDSMTSKIASSLAPTIGGFALGPAGAIMGGLFGGFIGDATADAFNARENEDMLDMMEDSYGKYGGLSKAAQIGYEATSDTGVKDNQAKTSQWGGLGSLAAMSAAAEAASERGLGGFNATGGTFGGGSTASNASRGVATEAGVRSALDAMGARFGWEGYSSAANTPTSASRKSSSVGGWLDGPEGSLGGLVGRAMDAAKNGTSLGFGTDPSRTSFDNSTGPSSHDGYGTDGINGRDGGGSNSGKNGGPSGRVICSELVRQGYLSKRLLKYEEFHTLKFYDADTIRGYHWWAVPFTKLMKKSKIATAIGKLFIFRAKEVAKILGKEPKGSIIGKIINAVVPRICKIIGKFVKYDKFDPRWDRADSERIIKVEK